MLIVLISPSTDCLKNYNFKKNPKKEFIKELKKCHEFDMANHPNYILNQIHKWCKIKKIEIKHYDDLKKNEKFDLILSFDVVDHKIFLNCDNIKKFLVLQEYKAIKPYIYKFENHKKFNKIFTFDDKLLNYDKYVKYSGLQVIPKKYKIYSNNKKKFACISFANKPNINKLSYFELRKKILDFFLDDPSFHLYGSGWDKKSIIPFGFNNIFNKIFIKLFYFIKNSFYNKNKKYFKIWKGYSNNIIKTYSNYKFVFCIENSPVLSSRIFHTFYSGAIPIYYGLTDINKKIPKNCFVNLREFSDLGLLKHYLKNIKNKEYKNFIINIRKFLKSKKYFQYTADNDVAIITQEINKELCLIKESKNL
jgi:hypothetical protein